MSNNKPPTAKPSERVTQARRTQSVQCLQDMVGQWGKEPNVAPTACTLAPHGNFPCRNLLQYQTNSQRGNWILRGRMILNPDTRDLRAKPASCRAQVSPSQQGKIIRGGHEHLPDQSEDNIKKPRHTMRLWLRAIRQLCMPFPLDFPDPAIREAPVHGSTNWWADEHTKPKPLQSSARVQPIGPLGPHVANANGTLNLGQGWPDRIWQTDA